MYILINLLNNKKHKFIYYILLINKKVNNIYLYNKIYGIYIINSNTLYLSLLIIYWIAMKLYKLKKLFK